MSIMKNLSWGVDGHGAQYFDCKHCGQYFGNMLFSDALKLDDVHDCNQGQEESAIYKKRKQPDYQKFNKRPFR